MSSSDKSIELGLGNILGTLKRVDDSRVGAATYYEDTPLFQIDEKGLILRHSIFHLLPIDYSLAIPRNLLKWRRTLNFSAC